MAELTPQRRLALEQQYYRLQQIERANDLLDSKGLALLQGAGILLALVGVLKLPDFVLYPTMWGKIGIAVGFLAFAAMVWLLALAWSPGDTVVPGTGSWDAVYDRYVSVDLVDSYDKVLVDTLEAFKLLAEINRNKAVRLQWGVALFLVQIVGLLVLALSS